MGNIRVLVVDDSGFVRGILTHILQSDNEIEVVGATGSGNAAIELAKELDPDVITLDIMLPDMDGVSVLRSLMQLHPIPVVIVSALSRQSIIRSLAALELGAIDVVEKPTSLASDELYLISNRLIASVKAASKLKGVVKRISKKCAEVSVLKLPHPESVFEVIAIGSSSGGPSALKALLSSLPADFGAAILVAQHMPKPFITHFAERLSKCTQLKVREANDGDVVESGVTLIAPGDKHMIVRRSSLTGKAVVKLSEEPKDMPCTPSVDLLFHSAADVFGRRCIGVLLSGMGKDGATGMRAIKEKGGRCIVQDESSCLIFGMPKAAIELGVVDEIVPIDRMAERLAQLVGRAKE
ncbi:MAG: chemotaxis response regulator protein-glutamate methylesterase [Armatimonadota bacterium]|nr:chemotaxis response regulator protein-glutamate methylesterase [Armatimonadota bacterium]MCX7777323.1 chemotaxis response regulator protein-glutamate methylesterase [Armatimonadota bacterium]MDW8024359.1 chemotaxis response regulator protein-glutamate methylesterase [Armatimonadota bacterium]